MSQCVRITAIVIICLDRTLPFAADTAHQALKFFVALYEVEREVPESDPERRHEIQEERRRTHRWGNVCAAQTRFKGCAIAKALDHTLKRWLALTRYPDEPDVPIDNNRIENLIRPWAVGPANWSFAGSLRAGQRAAAIMSLVRTAQINGHEPYAYLKEVLTRLPTQRADKIAELVPHHWTTASA